MDKADEMARRGRANVKVSGRVQGVLFRAYTREAASRFGVTGWVRNLYDGRVEGLFEGDKEAVSQLIDWCRKGPPSAQVTDVEVEWDEPTGEFDDFFIARSGGW